MKTKNIILGMVAAAVSAVLTGCYEKFDPAPEQAIYNDQWFADKNFTQVTIGDIKQLFADNVGDPANSSTYDRYYLINEPYYVKGKVISNDKFGNFYRSLYIQDAAGGADAQGIEIKVGLTGMYTKYVVGETIYVICQDLAVGNYRRNLSLGLPDTSGEYATKNIEVKYLVDIHLKQGERTTMTAADTLVINSSNVASLTGSDNLFTQKVSGRLVRVENARSVWGEYSGTPYPSFMYSSGTTYINELFTTLYDGWEAYDAIIAAGQATDEPAVPRPGNFYDVDRAPSWGYKSMDGSTSYYGSARFTMGGTAIVIRTSGYSRFVFDPVPADGEEVDMTGMINLYTTASGGYPANQFLINNSSDVR